MTKLLEQAIDAVRRLPPGNQDDIARALLLWSEPDLNPEPIDPAHLPAVLEGLDQAQRGELATDAEIEEVLRRFDE
jgi:hypothetical protein